MPCPTCGARLRVPGPASGAAAASDEADVLDAVPVADPSPIPAVSSARDKGSDEKYCLVCGALIYATAPICPDCGGSQLDSLDRQKKHCHECGAVLRGRAVICPQCGVEQGGFVPSAGAAANNRVAAGVCGILLGAMGVHKFILGYTWAGITTVLISVIGFCCYGWMAMHVVGIIEGIMYLSMSDRDFERIHGKRLRPWF